MVDATIHNRTTGEVRLIEVQYPSASFGVQSLPAGGEFHYRFKILGTGVPAVTYTPAGGAERTVKGPELREGEQGKLLISIETAGVRWMPTLTP